MPPTARPPTSDPAIVVHGGCGNTAPSPRQLSAIRRALDVGFAAMTQGGTAVDAVEAAVAAMEQSGRFNGGSGAKRQMDGIARLDASIMEGHALRAGAVASVEGVLTPIRAARIVMEHTPHVLLVGESASHLAKAHGLEAVPRRPHSSGYRSWRTLYNRWLNGQATPPVGHGTVGAVARDRRGLVAAATSTGGVNLMLPGRVGDSPIIGSGTYADNRSAAVSMTGTGETILRTCLARSITVRVEDGVFPADAAEQALTAMTHRVGGEAGAIVLPPSGEWAIVHTSRYMASGYRSTRRSRVAAQGRWVKAR